MEWPDRTSISILFIDNIDDGDGDSGGGGGPAFFPAFGGLTRIFKLDVDN